MVIARTSGVRPRFMLLALVVMLAPRSGVSDGLRTTSAEFAAFPWLSQGVQARALADSVADHLVDRFPPPAHATSRGRW